MHVDMFAPLQRASMNTYLIARGPNPLASIFGRICGAPCEAACRRGSIDEPISIRVLHIPTPCLFVTIWHVQRHACVSV